MCTRSMIRTLTIGGLILAVTGSAQAVDANRAAGRWNLTVEAKTDESKTYTHPAWLAIDGGRAGYTGRMLPGAGSVQPIGVVEVDGPKVKFNAWDYVWTGTVEGDVIKGQRVHKDDKNNRTSFSGKRARYEVNVTGKWAIKVLGEPAEHLAILELKHEGNTITGQLRRGDEKMPVSEARLNSNLIRLTVETGEDPLNLAAAIMGDRLGFGMMSQGKIKHRFDGYRLREWGEAVKLFNGNDLSNWEPIGKKTDKYHWKVMDGIMTNTGGGGSANIVSKEKFRNFRAHIEFRVPEGGNSGVYLRGRHEIQVADSAGQEPSWHMCGALYSRIAPNVNAARPAGEWQTFDITLVDNYVTVVHNGQVIIDNEEVEGVTGGMLDVNENEPGPIYLQGDHGQIEYRQITLWPAR